MASQQPLSRAQSPIAMSALSSGSLVVLGARGSLSIVNTENSEIRRVKQTLGYYNPADMAAAHIGQTDVILVAMYSNYGIAQQSVERRGILAEYSTSGEQLRTWPFVGRVFDAIAVDPDHKVAYLGEGLRGQISTLNLDAPTAEIKVLQELPASSRLGALAFDPDQQRLFAADAEQGQIYVIDVKHGTARTLTTSLGEPAALAYDRNGHNLYVADAARRCVWRVAVDDGIPTKALPFSSATGLREPRGLAIDSGHNVWVADFGALAVFQLGPKGEILKEIRP